MSWKWRCGIGHVATTVSGCTEVYSSFWSEQFDNFRVDREPAMPDNRLTISGPLWAALELAWEALGAGAVPVGAVVTDAAGSIISCGRSRRFERDAPPGQLAGSKIAHAEVNALAQLPGEGDYADYEIFTTVEPCALCMGAALMTGIGRVWYAFEDPYGGAGNIRVENARNELTSLQIEPTAEPMARSLSALMVFLHYRLVRPIEVVRKSLEATSPGIAAIAASRLGKELLSMAKLGTGLSDAVDPAIFDVAQTEP